MVRNASKREARGAVGPKKRERSLGVTPTMAPKRHPSVGGETAFWKSGWENTFQMVEEGVGGGEGGREVEDGREE